MLIKQSEYKYTGKTFDGVCIMGATGYDECVKNEKKLGDEKKAHFNATFASEIERLSKRGYEFQNGMIVKSLSNEENHLLGISNKSEKKDPNAPMTEAEKIAAKSFGSCYTTPDSPNCKSLLKQDFTYQFDANGGVTLTRNISSGQIGGRDSQGYYSEKQDRSRYVNLSKVNPVTAPKGKDLFDVWENEDWKDVESQATAVMNVFSKELEKDGKRLSQATAVVRNIESKNEAKFQAAKNAQVAKDSLIKDLLIAYISGGMGAVKGAIKNKIEDQINTGIATAWARATGADDDQIGMMSQVVSFMKGKIQERNIKTRANTFSINDPIRSVENFISKQNTLTNSVMSQVPVLGTLVQLGNSVMAAAARSAMGPRAYEATMNRVTGPKDTIAAIRANTESMIQSNLTHAIAISTGLPAEVVGNVITDYKGSQAAKKVRKAVNANPLTSISAQIEGVGGGIIKTAANAFGVKDRDIQRAFKDGNRLMFSGNLETSWAEIQSEANANTRFGMKAPGTSYTSATPTLKDKKGFVKELGQRATVDFLAQGKTKEEKEVINAAFRKGYGNMEQSKADKKAQANAARSTGIMAVTTIVTLGAASVASAAAAAANAATAAGASAATASVAATTAASTAVATGGVMGTIGGAMASVGTFVGASVTTAANVGAAIFNGAVQAIDGSRNGTQGILAGFANGAIGAFTAGGGLDLGKISSSLGTTLTPALKSTALGLGVTYDRQAGWGGMIGIGNASTNANISFSQRGNTTISGSANVPGVKGLQATLSSTTNGATTVGVNLNAGKGPREGWNVGANYDINGGGFSANIGYTDPNSGFGLTSTIDRTGLSTSGQLNGVNLATNGPNGFTMDEINWAERNINLAQDRGNHLEENALLLADGVTDPDSMSPTERNERLGKINADNEYKQLRDDGKSDEQIARMTPEQREAALDRINGVFNPDTWATAALATTGTFFAGALAFAGSANGTGTGQTPTNTNANGPVVGRRPKRKGEGDTDSNVPKPSEPPKRPEAPAPVPTPWAHPGEKGEESKNKSQKPPETPPRPPRIPKELLFPKPAIDETIDAKTLVKKLDGIIASRDSEILRLQKELSELNPKAKDYQKVKKQITTEIREIKAESEKATTDMKEVAADHQRKQDQPHLDEIKATSNLSKYLLMEKFRNEKFATAEDLKTLKAKLESLSSKELYEFSQDGKLLHGDLKHYTDTKEKIVREGTKEVSSNRVMDKEGVRLIKDKVTDLLTGKISSNLTNVKVSEGLESILRAQDLLRTRLNDPKLKTNPESLKTFSERLKDSQNVLFGNEKSAIPKTVLISDQLKKAQMDMDNFKAGKTKELSANTIEFVTKQLTNDPEFAKLSQPKGLKDSFARLEEMKVNLNNKINEMITKIPLSDKDIKQYSDELKKQAEIVEKAKTEHQKKWDNYSKDVSDLVKTRDADGNLNLTSLRKISEGLVKIETKILKTKEVYTIMRDKDGNVALIGDENANENINTTQAQRYREKELFQTKLKELNEVRGIRIDENTGEILGANGKPISDVTKRKEKWAEIKKNLGEDFNPSSNPHFAKMEALANFTPPDPDNTKNGNPNYRTSVNGVTFEFVSTHNVDPSKSILAANGADWMNLSNAAKESGVEGIGLTSVVRDDHSSHEMGYSMDVGSIKLEGEEKYTTIKFDHDHFEENKLPNPDKDSKFLEIVRSQSSIQYNLNPYYMVYSSGEVIPNFFTFAPKSLWDTQFTDLSKENQELVVTRMIKAARDHEPDSYTLTRDMAVRMWDHRNHLHISETGFGSK